MDNRAAHVAELRRLTDRCLSRQFRALRALLNVLGPLGVQDGFRVFLEAKEANAIECAFAGTKEEFPYWKGVRDAVASIRDATLHGAALIGLYEAEITRRRERLNAEREINQPHAEDA